MVLVFEDAAGRGRARAISNSGLINANFVTMWVPLENYGRGMH